jgi:hypothetical protein
VEVLHHLAGDVTGHGRAAGRDVANRGEQLFGRAGLDQITVRPGFERAENPFAVLINRHHYDLHGGGALLDFGDTLNAGHVRQFDVHEDHIRVGCQDPGQRFLGGNEGAQAFYVRGRLEDLDELLAQSPVVFHNDD